ncbi:MAG: Fe-S cluster assembly protein SufD [Alphaproteobacteria bacterium]|nr:Fe-S cluster assembly protein SufD [Alphaproteobacteria bacterium]
MSTSMTASQALNSRISGMEAITDSAPPPVRAWRRDARGRYAGTGLPTRRDEAWRWTDLSPLYEHLTRPAPVAQTLKNAPDGPFSAIDCWRLSFVNGELQEASADLPAGVRAMSLRTALLQDPALAAQMGSNGASAFLSLNSALAEDGAFIHVAAGTKLTKPVHLVFSNSSDAQIRNLVVLEPRADLMLLESHFGPAETDYFVNQVSDVQLAEGARLAHYRDQAEGLAALHFHYLNARLEGDAHYDGFTLTRGAHLSRNESHMAITGRHAQCRLNGVNILGGDQVCDTTSVMAHQAPASTSTQMFRNVLAGKSQGIFQGLIRVAKPAQRTDARQQIKALLLSTQAVQKSKPELEILADDVKCAHGASAGQLDAGALFYLRARGIGEAQARALLIGAFLEECVAQIEGGSAQEAEHIQQAMQAVIGAWLARQLAVENV